MSTADNRFSLISRNVSEIVTESDLKNILESKKVIKGYIGVEPSGLFHIGWIIWARKIIDFITAGVEMVFLEATWHAWINDKLGGKLENILDCASYIEYCLKAFGVTIEKLRLIKAEDTITDPAYWALLLKISKQLSLARVKRAMTIMGRKEKEANIDFSKLIYPAMQVADIFYLDLDLCLGGTDQRKAHILAREVADKLNLDKPVGIHTPLLIGLGGFRQTIDKKRGKQEDIVDMKMSKSKPETCIFIHDDEETVRRKILNAYCPSQKVEHNPIIEINHHILFAETGFKLEIDRPAKYGGSTRIEIFEELSQSYEKGEIHPLDLKNATAIALNKKLNPIRKYFEQNSKANELYKTLSKLTISR